jgi:hypothetical protein
MRWDDMRIHGRERQWQREWFEQLRLRQLQHPGLEQQRGDELREHHRRQLEWDRDLQQRQLEELQRQRLRQLQRELEELER